MFDHVPILIEDSQCLNRRHRQAGCALCVQACAVRAIHLHDGTPVLDLEACVGCGACLPACPTGVFSQRVLPEELLLQAVAQTARDERLAVVCPVHLDPAGSRAPVDRVLRHSRCLASLDVDHLLTLSRDGLHDVWLDDSRCVACSIGQAHSLILAAAQAGNALLQGFGRPANIRMASQDTGLLRGETDRLPVTQAVPKSLARRDVFAMLKRFGEGTVGQAPAGQRLSQRVPPARQRMLRHVQSWSAASDAGIAVDKTPFSVVQVDSDACSACGLCATLCPTGALRLDSAAPQDDVDFLPAHSTKAKSRVEWGLSFHPAACIDCGICAVACPEQAISFGATLPATALAGGNDLPLAGGRMTACVSCGAAMAIRPQDRRPVCYACRQGAGKVNPLADNAGLMADLLKRLPPADGEEHIGA